MQRELIRVRVSTFRAWPLKTTRTWPGPGGCQNVQPVFPGGITGGRPLKLLNHPIGQMLPLSAGPAPRFTFAVDAAEDTELIAELRTSNRPDNYTPDVLLATRNVTIDKGEGQAVSVDFGVEIDQARYAVICFNKNEKVKLHCSQQRLTGVLSLENNNTLLTGPISARNLTRISG